MRVRVLALRILLAEARVRRDVKLLADDGLDALLHAGVRELDRAGESPVIRDRASRLSHLRHPVDKRLDSDNRVEKRVAGMHVEVDETHVILVGWIRVPCAELQDPHCPMMLLGQFVPPRSIGIACPTVRFMERRPQSIHRPRCRQQIETHCRYVVQPSAKRCRRVLGTLCDTCLTHPKGAPRIRYSS
jgi:hypothetical protein